MRRGVYALVLLVYMVTPYVALGFHASNCQCVVSGIQCGTGGALCHCCMGEILMMECDDSAQFRSCKNAAGAQASSQPPAIAEPFAACSYDHMTARSLAETEGSTSDAFNLEHFKPPREA